MLPPKLILSPIDFSDHSQKALNVAADLATVFDSELLLFHAVPAVPRLPAASEIFQEAKYEGELHEDAEQRLQAMAQTLTQKGLRVKWELGLANEAGMEILRVAEHHNVDLIVIATHGMTGWHRLVFGSVAEKVVRLSHGPVLVLRAEGKEGS
jgi:nucleotide-binding universal stress UspA family protein